jgi:hypothetical protein
MGGKVGVVDDLILLDLLSDRNSMWNACLK